MAEQPKKSCKQQEGCSDAQLRLELVKLTHTHGRPAEEAVARASELERYVRNGASDNLFE